MDEAQKSKLIKCIQVHCTALTTDNPDAVESYAENIIAYDANSRALFGHTHDHSKITKLKKHLKHSETLLSEFSIETKQRLNDIIPKTPYEQRPWPSHPEVIPTKIDGKKKLSAIYHKEPSLTSNLGLVKERTAAINGLLVALEELEARPELRFKATQKRNYRAAAVFFACRKVWNEEINVNSPPCKDPENCTGYHRCTQGENCGVVAPWELHNDIHSPFAGFVDAVFSALGIGSTVQSATNALKELNGRNALHLSIAKG